MFEDVQKNKIQFTVFMFSSSLKYDSFCCMLSARSTSSDCEERKQQATADTIRLDILISVQQSSVFLRFLKWSKLNIFVNINSKTTKEKKKIAASIRYQICHRESEHQPFLFLLIYVMLFYTQRCALYFKLESVSPLGVTTVFKQFLNSEQIHSVHHADITANSAVS